MSSLSPPQVGRRVVVGLDDQGHSAAVKVGLSGARRLRPNGAVSTEIWRQERLPARTGDDGAREGEMAGSPPADGVTFRIFTLPPNTEAESADDVEAVAAIFGASNVGGQQGGPTLHRVDSFYVATVVAGRAYLVLEAEEVLLEHGDSFVLPGVLHTWRNPFPEHAVMACAVFPLQSD